MPKLSTQQVNAAQAQGYEEKSEELKPLPIEDGKPYVYKLVACTVGATKKNPAKMQWTWELTLDGRYHPDFVGNGYLEKVWHYTAVEGGQEWAIAKMLHAFGYSPETDTDELINEEATVLAFLTLDSYGTPPKVTMRARRFAQHYEDEYPQAISPMEQEANEKIAAHNAAVAAAPTEDPWAVTPAAEEPVAVPAQAAPVSTVKEDAPPMAAPHAEPADDDQF